MCAFHIICHRVTSRKYFCIIIYNIIFCYTMVSLALVLFVLYVQVSAYTFLLLVFSVVIFQTKPVQILQPIITCVYKMPFETLQTVLNINHQILSICSCLSVLRHRNRNTFIPRIIYHVYSSVQIIHSCSVMIIVQYVCTLPQSRMHSILLTHSIKVEMSNE